jgi:aminopeptidase N
MNLPAMKHPITLVFVLFLATHLFSQAQSFTLEDTLRGSITTERSWQDLSFYRLNVRVDPVSKTIEGSTLMRYKVLKSYQSLQIDLQPPLEIRKIVQDGQELTFTKKGRNAYFIYLYKPQVVGATESVEVFYGGAPVVAKRPPWDGGFSWSKDAAGEPFIATSCQGLGASVWWPCKDHMYDEPDSMAINITVPKGLMDVSNGRLSGTTDNPDGTTTYRWKVVNPINNYGVNVNIAHYTHFSDTYDGEKGKLSLDYYVLPANLEKAKTQFQQVSQMMKAFEHWFGPYPWYEDGFKLVEVPYLGMEHQSSVTYGNGYRNGYMGIDLSGTGWGLKWDFIIVHEAAHEWFANNITYKDIADMWIHESFANYAESLFTEYYYGKQAGAEYVIGLRKRIFNVSPIIGRYNVNNEGSTDMYYKGGNLLHMIRQIVNDDEKWRQILRGLNRQFYHQTVETKQIENFISEQAGINLGKVFDQYLRQDDIPALEVKRQGRKLKYRWTKCVDGFDMPLKVSIAGKPYEFIYPSTSWKELKIGRKEAFIVDENFYVKEM